MSEELKGSKNVLGRSRISTVPTASVMLEESESSEHIFGCLKSLTEMRASQGTDSPRRIQCALRSSADFKGIGRTARYHRDFDFPVLTVANDIFGYLRKLD